MNINFPVRIRKLCHRASGDEELRRRDVGED